MLSMNPLHLVCALEGLREYRAYADEMRKHGRGFHPSPGGFSVEATILALESALERAQAALEGKGQP